MLAEAPAQVVSTLNDCSLIVEHMPAYGCDSIREIHNKQGIHATELKGNSMYMLMQDGKIFKTNVVKSQRNAIQ